MALARRPIDRWGVSWVGFALDSIIVSHVVHYPRVYIKYTSVESRA